MASFCQQLHKSNVVSFCFAVEPKRAPALQSAFLAYGLADTLINHAHRSAVSLE